MASNATPKLVNDLIANGQGISAGLKTDDIQTGVKQNLYALFNDDLEGLKSAQSNFTEAEGKVITCYDNLHAADEAAGNFINMAVHVFSPTLGNSWNNGWLPTGMPDNSLRLPTTQDKRYATVGKLKAYLVQHSDMEVSLARIIVTADQAEALHQAITNTRKALADANSVTKTALQARDAAMVTFQDRYHGTVAELDQLLSDDDARWYKFGLNRPVDPAQPDAPMNVTATALGGGRVLLATDGSRRSHSIDYYRQITGTDLAPVKIANDPSTQYTVEALPAGKSVAFTLTGVNDAGEGPSSDPVTVVIT